MACYLQGMCTTCVYPTLRNTPPKIKWTLLELNSRRLRLNGHVVAIATKSYFTYQLLKAFEIDFTICFFLFDFETGQTECGWFGNHAGKGQTGEESSRIFFLQRVKRHHVAPLHPFFKKFSYLSKVLLKFHLGLCLWGGEKKDVMDASTKNG